MTKCRYNSPVSTRTAGEKGRIGVSSPYHTTGHRWNPRGCSSKSATFTERLYSVNREGRGRKNPAPVLFLEKTKRGELANRLRKKEEGIRATPFFPGGSQKSRC